MMRITHLFLYAAIHASALVPPQLQRTQPRAQKTVRSMAPLGETVKNTAIVTWLFGGLVPALIAVNSFAFTKLSSPARYDGFVETGGQGAKMALANIGAPDAVLEEDVSQILDAFATPDESLFVPLAVAIGAPGGGEGDYLGAERYVARDAFKATIRRKARQAPDAALDAVFDAWAKGSGCAARSQCIGSLESWRRNDGSWDLGAADRDILLGKGVVLGGFVGLAVIDFVALSALVFFARTILFAES